MILGLTKIGMNQGSHFMLTAAEAGGVMLPAVIRCDAWAKEVKEACAAIGTDVRMNRARITLTHLRHGMVLRRTSGVPSAPLSRNGSPVSTVRDRHGFQRGLCLLQHCLRRPV